MKYKIIEHKDFRGDKYYMIRRSYLGGLLTLPYTEPHINVLSPLSDFVIEHVSVAYNSEEDAINAVKEYKKFNVKTKDGIKIEKAHNGYFTRKFWYMDDYFGVIYKSCGYINDNLDYLVHRVDALMQQRRNEKYKKSKIVTID